MSAFCGAGRASAGRDRRDGGVFYGGKPKTRSHICRAFVTDKAFDVFIPRPFREDGSSTSHSGLGTAGVDQPLSNETILAH